MTIKGNYKQIMDSLNLSNSFIYAIKSNTKKDSTKTRYCSTYYLIFMFNQSLLMPFVTNLL